MLKALAAALFAFLTGVCITTLKKDKEILQLNKRITHLESYEYFSDVFQSGWRAGNDWGRHRGYIAHAQGQPLYETN